MGMRRATEVAKDNEKAQDNKKALVFYVAKEDTQETKLRRRRSFIEAEKAAASAKGLGVITALFLQSTGVKVYFANGAYRRAGGRTPFYLRELENLCSSLARYSPGLALSVITDAPTVFRNAQGAPDYDKCAALDRLLPNRVPLKPNVSWAEKPVALLQSPYARTLFLDVDTTVCAPLRPLFDILSQYDIATAPEPLDLSDMRRLANPGAADVPTQRYFEMNSGVVLYRNTAQMSKLFREMARRQKGGDQDFFHLYGTAMGLLGKTAKIRVLQLPPEYNLRMRGGDAPRLLTQTVRVIHGKSANFPHISCESVNQHRGFRLWSSSGGTVPISSGVPSGAMPNSSGADIGELRATSLG